jgi:hypothetical protein
MADERDRDEAAGGEPPTRHAYPRDLMEVTLAALRRRGDGVVASPLLEPARLESLLSTAYQASLLRDEGRQVIFRLLVAPPEALPAAGGPPNGLHVLRFSERRVCDVTELRRLAAAAPYHRALIGACIDGHGRPALWGVVHVGARWLRVQTGGRLAAPALPQALVVSVGGPGRLEVELGDEPLARLEAGRIGGTTLDVFASRWLPLQFAPVRAELMAQHAADRAAAGAPWAPLDESLIRGIGQHMVRQLIAVIRAARHGATLLVVPPEAEATLLAPDSFLHVHYRLVGDEARRRYRTLILRIMNRIASTHAGPLAEAVGWAEYQHSGAVRGLAPHRRLRRRRRCGVDDPQLRDPRLRRRDRRQSARRADGDARRRHRGARAHRRIHRTGRHPPPLRLPPLPGDAGGARRHRLPGRRRALRVLAGRRGDVLALPVGPPAGGVAACAG